MKNSRKIDEIYRNRLLNVETPPPADVWQNIEAKLPVTRTKTRVLPLWLQLGGAAAVVALLFGIFSNSFQTSTSATNHTYVQNVSYQLELDTKSQLFDENMLRSSILLEIFKAETKSIAANEQLPHHYKPVNLAESRNFQPVHASEKKSQTTDQRLAEEAGNATEKSPNRDLPAHKNTLGQPQQNTLTGYANEVHTPKSVEDASEPSGNEEHQLYKKDAGTPSNAALVDSNTSEKNQNQQNQKDITKSYTEEASEETPLSRRFSITPTAAAVYFDNLGGGNSLDRQLSNNPGAGEISMAYGVQLAYQVSEKIKVRSGVNLVNLNYTTQNVGYAAALNSGSIEILDSAASNFSLDRGTLNQQLGFVEIPIEMEYALLSRKVGLSIIGGASTLILEKNSVSLTASNFSTNIGEANNLNSLSFSANLGVGINYNLSRNFRLNLEPIFKYQLNTFNNSPGLNPYYFGVYSGFSFKF